MEQIKFGTAGWRGILAKDFTYKNAGLVVQGICDYLKDLGATQNGLYIGFDSRFQGEQFAELARTIVTRNGIRVLYTDRETPTPVISWIILDQKLDGGINFTASHNDPYYNGIKFTPSWGGPALPETTRRIEENIESLIKKNREVHLAQGRPQLAQLTDFRDDYFNHLKKLVNLSVVREAEIEILCDPLYGAARGYLNGILSTEGIKAKTLHNYRDPYFGGHSPEPSAENLREMADELRELRGFSVGLALDGDGDKFGILDTGGLFIPQNYVLALLLHYLLRTREYERSLGVARTVTTTHLIDRIAEKHDRALYETPVGFKYIGDLITKDQIVMGGEESGGLSIYGHLPEKDGILACLLVLEYMAATGKTLYQGLKELYDELGTLRCRRIDVHLEGEGRGELEARLRRLPARFGGRAILHTKALDGMKVFLEDDSWVLFRCSGTEPLVRIYLEAGSDEVLDALEHDARAFLAQQP